MAVQKLIICTVEHLVKDTLNKEHLSIKDKSRHPNSHYTMASTFQPLNKGSQDKKLNFIGVENLKDRAKSIHISA